MGRLSTQAIKFDTIKTYIAFIKRLLTYVKILHPRIQNGQKTFEEIQPMVRFENSNKSMWRKLYEAYDRDIITNADIYKFPLVSFKLSNMSLDQKRFGVSPYKFEGEIRDQSQQLSNLAKYLKTPVPYNYTFSVTIWSNLYSHLLDYIENFVYHYTPANVFTLKILESNDKQFKLLHDTVLYINDFAVPEPSDTIDENTNQPIQSMNLNIVLKGIQIPAITEASVIKHIQSNYSLTNADLSELESSGPNRYCISEEDAASISNQTYAKFTTIVPEEDET